MNQIADQWKDYEILDAGSKEKLERWNTTVLRRPDPVAIWPIEDESEWKKADAVYHRSRKGGGSWEYKKPLKDSWTVAYKDLRFKITPTGFKHTGLFPEQAANWDFIMKTIRDAKKESDAPIRVLNLFAYTGGATMAASKAGADEVVHLDASKGINAWAKENMELNHLQDKKIRFLVEDALKFIKREQRRGRTYQAIIMDPPSYGRGPDGEVWKLEDSIYELLYEAQKLLADDALFMIVNMYTTGFPLTSLQQTLERTVVKHHGGSVETGETLLPIRKDHALLPCGIFGRWTSDLAIRQKEEAVKD